MKGTQITRPLGATESSEEKSVSDPDPDDPRVFARSRSDQKIPNKS